MTSVSVPEGIPSDWKELIITQTCTSSVSLVASSTIVAFIVFGESPPTDNADASSRRADRDGGNGNGNGGRFAGLQTPYRRLIFSLSVTDIIQSLSILLGPFLSPSDQLLAHWGLGNKVTCQIDGLMFLIGTTAVPMYTCALCVYYVQKLKYKMTDEAFTHKYEKKMHIGIIAVNLLIYITALVMDVIHTTPFGNLCSASTYPSGCRIYSDIVGECDPLITKRSFIIIVFNSFLNPIICYIGIISTIVMILSHAIFREKVFGTSTKVFKRSRSALTQCHSSSEQNIVPDNALQLQPGQNQDKDQDQENTQVQSQSQPKPQNHRQLHVPSVSDEDDASRSISTLRPRMSSRLAMTQSEIEEKLRDQETISRLYKAELVTQASCYVGVFCLTSLPFLTVTSILLSGSYPNMMMMRANVLLGPLGGLLNILVYTRPNTASFRRRHPDCSRLWALCLVLRAGGEIPDAYPGSFCTMFPWGSGNRHQSEEEDLPQDMVFDSAILHFHPSSQPIGVAPSVEESIPNSAHGVDGRSLSIDEKHAMYRLSKDWTYIKGGKPRAHESQNQYDADDNVAGSQDLADFDDFSSRMDSSSKWISSCVSASTRQSSNTNDGRANDENEVTDAV